MHTVCILWKVDPQNPPENWLLRQRKLGKKYLKVFNSHFLPFFYRYNKNVTSEDLLTARESNDPSKIEEVEKELDTKRKVEEAKRDIINFVCLQMGISCLHPDFDPATWPPPTGQIPFRTTVNPLRLDIEETLSTEESILQNYSRLANMVQIHHCRHNYCLREVKKKKGIEKDPNIIERDGKFYECRFKFPQETHGFELKTEKGQNGGDFIVEANFDGSHYPGALIPDQNYDPAVSKVTVNRDLQMARNHPFVSSHIKEIALGFGANTDAQLIRSEHQCQAYLGKYVNKEEPNSNAHKKVLKAAASKLNENSSLRGGLQKIMIQTTTRETCRQEAVIMMKKDGEFTNFSLPDRHVGLGGGMRVSLDAANPHAKAVNDSGWQQKYWERETDPNYQAAVELFERNPDAWRELVQNVHPDYKNPVHPRDVSLHEFCAFFKKDWTLNPSEHFPVFTPFYRMAVNPNNTELYEKSFRNRLLQFKPGTTPDNVLGGFETHEDCVKDFVENNPRCPQLLKELYEEAQKKKSKKKEAEREEDNYDDFLDVSDDDLCPEIDGKMFKLFM